MEWLQVITILGTNLGMFIWARSESAQDRRQIFDLMKFVYFVFPESIFPNLVNPNSVFPNSVFQDSFFLKLGSL